MSTPPSRFLDTNSLVRLLTRDDEAKAKKALALLARVELDEEQVVTSPMVIFETVFTLQGRYKLPREQIRRVILDLLSFRSLRLPNKSIYRRALDIYVSKNISFGDAYNAAYMDAKGISEIYSWDRDFDKLPGITRVEPSESE